MKYDVKTLSGCWSVGRSVVRSFNENTHNLFLLYFSRHRLFNGYGCHTCRWLLFYSLLHAQYVCSLLLLSAEFNFQFHLGQEKEMAYE